ncbi:hypothetical protein [Actinomadura miaoliensis]|uniref:Uncharacterized protein n=1 Tax=Actinomadura miaoliensis TaxID=430685 RepID=A0ABP7UYH3_9ACTN
MGSAAQRHCDQEHHQGGGRAVGAITIDALSLNRFEAPGWASMTARAQLADRFGTKPPASRCWSPPARAPSMPPAAK